MSNPESFEQKPEFPDYFGLRDNLGEAFESLANTSTAIAMEQMIGDGTTEEIAKSVIAQAGQLAALQYTTRAAELLDWFEKIGLEETEQTAHLYTNYRVARLRIAEATYDYVPTLLLDEIVAEHENSPAQTDETSTYLYQTAAEHGHARSFEKYFEYLLKPFLPENEGEVNLAKAQSEIRRFGYMMLHTIYRNAWETRVEGEEMNYFDSIFVDYLQVITQNVVRTEHKAVYAAAFVDLIEDYYDERYYQEPKPKVILEAAITANKTLFEAGVVHASEKEHLSRKEFMSRKMVIGTLAAASQIYRKKFAKDLLEKWTEEGRIDESDLEIVENIEAARFGKKKKKKRKKQNSNPEN